MLVITSTNCVENRLPGQDNEVEAVTNDAVEDDGTTVLDDEYFEENGLNEDVAEGIIWVNRHRLGRNNNPHTAAARPGIYFTTLKNCSP